MTTYPTTLDSYNKPSITTKMDDSGYEGDVLLDNIMDSLAQLETKLGVNSSAVTTSIDYMVRSTSSLNPGHKHTLANGANDVTSTATELNLLHGVTAGTVSASKFVLVDASKNIDFGTGIVTNTGTVSTNITLQNTGNLTLGNTTTIKGRDDGWRLSADTWVYASATTFTIVGVDRTDVLGKGDKIRLKQGGGYKYFSITLVAFSTDTTVTITGGSDYTLTNAGITANSYAKGRAAGFPDYFAWESSPTGFSGTPTKVTKFTLEGALVTCIISITGTSNTTGFTFSAPLTSASTQSSMSLVFGQSNAADEIAFLNLGTSTTTVNATLLAVSGATVGTGGSWVNSGSKIIYGTLIYSI